MDISFIQPFLDWIEHNPALSGLIIFLVAAGESLALVGILVPGVVFMLGVGTLVGLNAIGLGSSLFWATAGAISGDWLSYWLGRHYDRQLRHIWPLSRYPRLIPRGERFFKRHGGKSVLFGRFVGPLRPIIPAVAGIMHMPQWKFYLVNVVSAVLWAPVAILPGVAFGESLQMANEVVMHLIAVIALVTVGAGIAGYLLRALFSYALATSVETWMDYFGLRGARENLVSLGLAGLLILSVALFVQYYEIRFQPLSSKSQATDFQWWQRNWQTFFKVHTQYDKERPVTLQWWGTLDTIEPALTQAGWQQAARLTAKNSLNFFLADARYDQLPVIPEKLFNHKEVLLMVAPDNEHGGFYVLRLWSANPLVRRDAEQLWLGSIHGVKVFSPFNLLNLPMPRQDFSQALAHFRQQLGKSRIPVSVKEASYQKLGISASWSGEVLLLHDNSSTAAPVIGDNGTLQAYAVGRSGLYIDAPGPLRVTTETPAFDKTGQALQRGSYAYRNNGINLIIDYEGKVNKSQSLSQLRVQLEQQLRNAPGLVLMDITSQRFTDGESENIRGIQYRVQYQMPPFDKQLNYRIKLLQQSGHRWLLSASYKDCDKRGQRLVDTMLDSVALPTTARH